jgi:hypothetical protein
MYYFPRSTLNLQTTLRSAVSAFPIRLYVTLSRWCNVSYINLGSGPVRLNVQGSSQACVIHRKESQSVSFNCNSCLRQLDLSVMPGKPKKVCIVGSGNWWVYEPSYKICVCLRAAFGGVFLVDVLQIWNVPGFVNGKVKLLIY